MALYRVTDITARGGVGFRVGRDNYTLSAGESVEVVFITQELRRFEEVGHVRIDVLIPDPTTDIVASTIVDGDTTHAPSGNAVHDAIADLQAQISAITLTESGVPFVDRIVVDSDHITNKAIPLTYMPVAPMGVQLFPDGGLPQRYGVDYTVSGEFITFDSLGLDNFLEVGDILDILYNH